MWKIGHRGASGIYPENTMLAFHKAIELGANALEFDVHACKSGEAVIIHDATLKGTTNGCGRVDMHTLSELQKLDAGRGERIPTLQEVLDEFAARVVLFIELKSAAASEPVAKLITHFARLGVPYSHMPVIGFGASWLEETKRFDPAILIGSSPDDARSIPPDYCARARQKNMWSVNPCIRQLNSAFMKEARAHGLKVVTWTANSKRQIEKARGLGVDGIISDFPDRL
jgi:glycerophosphoryl diester phosphodiesterase